MNRRPCGFAESPSDDGPAAQTLGHEVPGGRQCARVVLVTAAGTVDITPAATDLLRLARLAVTGAFATGMATPSKPRACPLAWSLLCRHLGECSGSPDCPAPDDAHVLPGAEQSDSAIASPARQPIAVTLASARPHALTALRRQLALQPDIALTEASAVTPLPHAADGDGVLPDVLVVDQSLCDSSSLRAIAALRARRPDLRIVVCGEDATANLCVTIARHRFHGLLLSHCAPAVGVKAIRAVLRGELWLSRALLGQLVAERGDAASGAAALPDVGDSNSIIDGALTDRQSQIVGHLRQGFTNKEIARRLGIQEDTVKKHLQAVFGKLGVRRRALVALANGAIPDQRRVVIRQVACRKSENPAP